MDKKKLSYNQLREILSLTISNKTLKAKFADFLNGKLTEITEVELLDLIGKSQVDKDLIRILSGKDPNKMDALEGLEYIADFFGYIRANKKKFSSWLENLGLAAKEQGTTPSNVSK